MHYKKHSLLLSLFIALLFPTVVSAQSRTCPKCGRSISVRDYANHQSSCKGKVEQAKPPTPTTKVCGQCRQSKALSSFSGKSSICNACVQYNDRQAELEQQDKDRREAEKRQAEADSIAEAKRQAEERRQAEADSIAEAKRQAEENKRREFAAKIKADMVFVEGGTFMMGALPNDKNAESDETPRHQVTLSSFSIGKYEVTQELWQAVMGSNPSMFKGDLKRPVERVSWDDCQEFIHKLNELTGEKFRLPTEAEWEYAARGGQKSRGYLYSGSNDIKSVAWYDGNSGDTTHPVGQKQPNELGLYDMSGNVWEWCQDRYGKYNSSAQTNPKGPSHAYNRVNRVYRGGSWYHRVRLCRASLRFYGLPGDRYGHGLRLAL